MTRRTFLWSLAAASAASAAGTALARNVRRELVVRTHRVPLVGARGARVVQLTDLHAGWGTPEELLDEAITRTHEEQPDLVVLTGDYVNHSLKHLQRVRRVVSSLPRPCVATLGNHDHWAGTDEIRRALEREGVTVLVNQSTRVDLGRAGEIVVVGVDDGFTKRANVASSFDGVEHPDRALVLAHYPNTADEIATRGGRLVLSGHTHGGQIAVPIVTPAISRGVGTRYLRGWYRTGEARLYVNVGIGSSASRWRVGTGATPEIAVFLLEDAAEVPS